MGVMKRINLRTKKGRKQPNEYQTKDPKGNKRWNFEKPLKFPVKILAHENAVPECLATALETEVVPATIQPLDTISNSLIHGKDAREVKFCRDYSKQIGGICEFTTPDGRVDILTENSVIEVKIAHNWKHGVGQVLVYSFYFPTRKPVLMLLDDVEGVYHQAALPHCDRLGIGLESKSSAQ
jgi:hypothetical protein